MISESLSIQIKDNGEVIGNGQVKNTDQQDDDSMVNSIIAREYSSSEMLLFQLTIKNKI